MPFMQNNKENVYGYGFDFWWSQKLNVDKWIVDKVAVKHMRKPVSTNAMLDEMNELARKYRLRISKD